MMNVIARRSIDRRSNPEIFAGLPRSLCSLAMTILLYMFGVSSAHAQSTEPDITSNLVGHWKLDEQSGTGIIDYASNNNGTVQGGLDPATDSVSGRVGRALNFNGGGEYIDLDTPGNAENLLRNVSEATVSAWVKADTLSGDHLIVTFDSGSGGSGSRFFYYITSDGNVNLGGRSDDNESFQAITTTTSPINAGEWNHIVGVIDYANDTNTLYINGYQVLSDNSLSYSLSATEDSPSSNVAIGSEDGGGGNYFLGDIDDVRVYDRALTAADVKYLYESFDGNVRYDTDARVPKYFNGENWIAMGESKYIPNAVSFDQGSEYLTYASDYAGVVDGRTWTASLWYRAISDKDQTIVGRSVGTTRYQMGVNPGGTLIRIRGWDSANTSIFRSDYAPTININDGNWHHVLFSYDIDNFSGSRLFIDDVEQTNLTIYEQNSSNDIDFTTGSHGVSESGGQWIMDAELADYWVDFGTYVDLSIEANRRKFIDENGDPAYLGPTGSVPTGSAPDVFLTGDTDSWHVNKGTGGGFTENGALTTAGFQVSNPQAISVTGYDITPESSSIEGLPMLYGSYVFFVNADTPDGVLYVLDVSDPSSPSLVTSFTDPVLDDTEMDVTLVYPYIYVASRNKDIIGAIDVSDPENPVARGTLSQTMGNLRGVYSTSGYFFVFDNNELFSFDMSDPDNPILLDTLSFSDCAAKCTISSGERIYMSNSSNNMDIINISDPSNLTITDDYITGLPFAVDGGVANDEYVIFYSDDSGTDTMYVFDISDPDAPVQVNEFTTRNYDELYMDGDLLLAEDLSNFSLLRFKDGTLREIGGYNAGGAERLARIAGINGRYAYGVKRCCGEDEDIVVLDLATCSNPARTAGSILYNATSKVAQYCDDAEWQAMGPVPGDGSGGCANPTRPEGSMVFNKDYRVMQYCEGDEWVSVGSWTPPPSGPTNCPSIGDTCDDGSIYAGLSPDGNVAMYTTPADAASTYTWNDGTTNYTDMSMVNCTDASPGTAATCQTGEANTAFLVGATGEPDYPFAAAEYCNGLSAHGYDDWYLPAQDELNVLYTNRNVGDLNLTFDETGSWPSGQYWSSSELSDTSGSSQAFGDGALTDGEQFGGAKQNTFSVRCVRR